MPTWRIISLHMVVSIFGFIDAIAMNSITATVEFLTGLVRIVGIWENVESINNNPARQMKPHVVYNDAVLRFRAYRERVGGIVAVDTDCFRRHTLRNRLAWVSGFQWIRHRQRQTEPSPASFTSTLSVVAILCNDRVATAGVTQGNSPGSKWT